MPIWGEGLVGIKEDKWQTKSWELCPNIPTTDRETPKETLHAWCPQICTVHCLHNPYTGPSEGPLNHKEVPGQVLWLILN